MTESSNAPNLADVILRLDRLELLLERLVDAVERQGMSAAPAREAAPRPVAAPSAFIPPAPVIAPPSRPEPPVIEVAPPPNAPQPVSQAAPAGATAEPKREYDPYGYRTDIVVPPANAGIQQVLAAVFEAGLKAEPEDTWAMMTKLTHASQMLGPRALDHFKAFAWHKLRRTATTYLRNNDPTTFGIAYTDPAEVGPEVDRVRVFIRAGDHRMPVPVTLARDVSQEGAWRLTMISL